MILFLKRLLLVRFFLDGCVLALANTCTKTKVILPNCSNKPQILTIMIRVVAVHTAMALVEPIAGLFNEHPPEVMISHIADDSLIQECLG
jgi:hypothetical protein